jgi:hypothetical protein
MTGHKETSEKLNKTLLFIVTLLNDNNIDKWFVCYGTLLGLVRENSCIDNDDDIDIIIEKGHFDLVKKILHENGFCFEYDYLIGDSRKIIKTKATSVYTTIDIYMGEFKGENVMDLWNILDIKDCFIDNEKKTLVERIWNGQKVYYPNNYERILLNRYGSTWKIKIDKKIEQTMTVL